METPIPFCVFLPELGVDNEKDNDLVIQMLAINGSFWLDVVPLEVFERITLVNSLRDFRAQEQRAPSHQASVSRPFYGVPQKLVRRPQVIFDDVLMVGVFNFLGRI